MKSRNLVLGVVFVAMLAGCRNSEVGVTGGYGSSVVTGQVFMSDDVANNSPAGVEVSVVGTGMMTTLGADGRFAFIDVPENAELLLQRSADGISGRVLIESGQPMIVSLGQASASAGGRRRGGGAAGKREYEGIIRSIDGDSIVLYTSHKEEVTVKTDGSTVFRKGNQTLTLADFEVDDRVHIKATMKDGVLTAFEVKLQNPGEDDDDDAGGNTMTANGLVLSVHGSELVVQSQPKGEVTVRTDDNTIIKQQGARISVSDIKVGWEVNTQGERIDDQTLLARQIEVRGNSKKKT